VHGECCEHADKNDKFCVLYNMLSKPEQTEIRELWGDDCGADDTDVAKAMEKRKPNFLRFGRSGMKKSDKPVFLRFGRAVDNTPNFLRFGRKPNFLRFGRKPNFLRFGKRSADIVIDVDQDDEFDRETRKPNFLRFGK